MLEPTAYPAINNKLIDFILHFPFPYTDILQEQISVCEICNEVYRDCYILYFHRKEDVNPLPLWLPTVPQGCQVLKENGPLACLLYVECGYIVQFEVVDMGLNEIDWEYLWSHKPIFDREYCLETILKHLSQQKITIQQVNIGQSHIDFDLMTENGSHKAYFWNCNILSYDKLTGINNCRLDIFASDKDEYQYIITFDNQPVMECSLVTL